MVSVDGKMVGHLELEFCGLCRKHMSLRHTGEMASGGLWWLLGACVFEGQVVIRRLGCTGASLQGFTGEGEPGAGSLGGVQGLETPSGGGLHGLPSPQGWLLLPVVLRSFSARLWMDSPVDSEARGVPRDGHSGHTPVVPGGGRSPPRSYSPAVGGECG